MPRNKKTLVINQPRDIKHFFSQFSLSESYVSLVLGVIVVMLASILLLAFLKNKNSAGKSLQEISSDKIEQAREEAKVTQSESYTVAYGETLWSIAEKIYKSGYNWVDIANANNLENPGAIEAGEKLTLPKVEVKAVLAEANQTVQQDTLVNNDTAVNSDSSVNQVQSDNKITGSTYTVTKGDDLWNIAVRAYGDGYAWVKIADANNLTDPNLIFSGNSLTIPR